MAPSLLTLIIKCPQSSVKRGFRENTEVRELTLHEDGGVGVQRLPKHGILCLRTRHTLFLI